MKKNSFLKDLARNTAIFLGAGELSGKKQQKQKELDDMYDEDFYDLPRLSDSDDSDSDSDDDSG